MSLNGSNIFAEKNKKNPKGKLLCKYRAFLSIILKILKYKQNDCIPSIVLKTTLNSDSTYIVIAIDNWDRMIG